MSIKHQNNKILIDELKRTFPIYGLGIIFHAITTYIVYKIPSIIGNILDLLIDGNVTKDIILNEAYILIFYSVIMIVPRVIYRVLFFTKARISETYLRKKVIEHLQDVRPEYFDKEDKGVFLAYLSKEILAIRKFLGNIFFYGTRIVISPIIGLIVIGNDFNMLLSLTIIPIIPIAVINIYKLYKEKKETIEKSRKVYLELSSTIEQNTSGFSLIKLYNEQDNQRKKFRKINQEIYKADYNIGVVKNKISNVINILYASCYCIGFTVGLILISREMLTVGELTGYISCISIAISVIVNSLEPFMNGLAYFKQASNRYSYFFSLDKYKKDGKLLNDINKIEIKNLSYSYEDNENYAIEDINLTINKGEKIGIIGQVGSGKTTLMNILAGFYEVPNNKVFINDIDINEYSRDSIFENIGYAMQKNIITDDTIRNNIDIREEAKEYEIEEITKKANIYEDIQTMKDGLETKIGENGVKVSGGQKQRIQIARNLLNIRKVNIFDDTLSALDIETEKKVIKEIEQQVGDNILIVISNKISMMERMDKVYILLDGKIATNGTHKELLESNSFYKELNEYEMAGDLV